MPLTKIMSPVKDEDSENSSPVHCGRPNAFELLMSVRPKPSTPCADKVESAVDKRESELNQISARKKKKEIGEKLLRMSKAKKRSKLDMSEEVTAKKKKILVVSETDSDDEYESPSKNHRNVLISVDVQLSNQKKSKPKPKKRKVIIPDSDDDKDEVPLVDVPHVEKSDVVIELNVQSMALMTEKNSDDDFEPVAKPKKPKSKLTNLRQSKLKLQPVKPHVEKKRNSLFNYFNSTAKNESNGEREETVKDSDVIVVPSKTSVPPSNSSSSVALPITPRKNIKTKQDVSETRDEICNDQVIVKKVARTPKRTERKKERPAYLKDLKLRIKLPGLVHVGSPAETAGSNEFLDEWQSPPKKKEKVKRQTTPKKTTKNELKTDVKSPTNAKSPKAETLGARIESPVKLPVKGKSPLKSPDKGKSPGKTTVKGKSSVKSPVKGKSSFTPPVKGKSSVKSPVTGKLSVKSTVKGKSVVKSTKQTLKNSSEKSPIKSKNKALLKTPVKKSLTKENKKSVKSPSKRTKTTVKTPTKLLGTPTKTKLALKSVTTPVKVAKTPKKIKSKTKKTSKFTPTKIPSIKSDKSSSKDTTKNCHTPLKDKVAGKIKSPKGRSPKSAKSSPAKLKSSGSVKMSSQKTRPTSDFFLPKSKTKPTLKTATVKNKKLTASSKSTKPSSTKVVEPPKVKSDNEASRKSGRTRKPVLQLVINETDEEDDEDSDDDIKIISVVKSPVKNAKPPVKLASLFLKKKTEPEVVITEDPAVVAARQRFLHSGVPECVKKMVEILHRDEPELSIFPTIAHVRQEDSSDVWNLPCVEHKLRPVVDTTFSFAAASIPSGTVTNQNVAMFERPNPPMRIASYRKIVETLKLENPTYRINHRYKVLKNKYLLARSLPEESLEEVQVKKRASKRKREEPKDPQIIPKATEVWTEKYKPSSSEEVVGNVNQVDKLKTWLESWKKFRKCDDPNYNAPKRKRSKSGSSDDFIDDDFSESEDERDMPISTALIFGPIGSGKTSSVYAVANELGFKVLEINASSQRTGKSLAKLQEATQSHRVITQAENCANMFTKTKKGKREATKPAKEDSDMSLILIENADIVFEDEDEGFVAALIALVASSKRPLVMVANNSRCLHLSRFIEQSLVLEFLPPDVEKLSIWLQLICLIEGVRASRNALVTLANANKCDVNRCLTQLQFWVLSGGNNLDSYDKPSQDEDSNSMEELPDEHVRCVEVFSGDSSNLCPFPVNSAGLWWNLAPMLSMPQLSLRRVVVEPSASRNPADDVNEIMEDMNTGGETHSIFDKLKTKNKTVEVDPPPVMEQEQPVEKIAYKSVCDQKDIDSVLMLSESLSLIDVISLNPRLNGDWVDMGPGPRVWEVGTEDGVCVVANDRPCWSHDELVAQTLIHWVAETSVDACRRQLKKGEQEDVCYDVTLPSFEQISWRTEQQTADNTICSLISLNYLPDHRATFSDYLATLQSMCRHENSRLATNTKRRNRFFHYLRGLGVHPSEETLGILFSTFDTGLWRCHRADVA